jgi:hypothetical protein
MSYALVHSGSYGLGTFFTTTTNTTTGHYSVTTQAGNLLILVIAFINQDPNASVPSIGTPSTPGFTWVLAGTITSDNYFDGTFNNQQSIAVYYIDNAPSMAASVITSVVGTLSVAPNNHNDTLSFELSEWSGEVIGSVIDVTATAKGISTVPSAGSINTNFTDLLLVSATDIGGNTEGSGFTALNNHNPPPHITAIAGAINQYILNAVPGTYNTSFVASAGVPLYCWGCVAIGFKATGGGGGGFPYSHGTLIGF